MKINLIVKRNQIYFASKAGLIFFVVPHLFNQWRGEASSRGEREIRNELSFQASDRPRKKRRSERRA
jgi:hypothetical protein